MDSITEQLSQLQELKDDQLSELENSVLSEFDATESQDLTPQSVDRLEQLANAAEAIRTEKGRRVEAMQALQAKAAEAATKMRGPGDVAPDANSDPEGLIDEAPEDSPADTDADPNMPDAMPVPPTEDQKVKPTFAAETKTAAPVEPVVETPAPVAAAAETDKADKKDDAKSDKPTEAAAGTETVEPTPKPETEASSTEETATQENTPEAQASVQSDTTPEANVTATAGTGDSPIIEPPADRRPVVPTTTQMSITAGADIPGMTAGTKLSDSRAVAEAFLKRMHSLRNVHGGDGEQHIVASLAFETPDTRFLEANDSLGNTDKIQAITAPAAITAAAGICLPLETNYEMHCDIGVTDRPIRDALARFTADRGGIRYFTAPQLEDEVAATGFWRGDANGQNYATFGPDGVTATVPANQKPCLEVQCTDERSAYVEAVTLCLTFNNLTTRTFPELIKRHNDLAMVAHARIAENHLLAQLEAGSTPIQAQTQVVGATREFLNLLSRAVAQYRFKHRMSTVQPMRVIAPQWVMDMMRSDLALQMPGDGVENTLGIAEATIESWFRSRGVNITWHMDGVGPAINDLDGAGAGTAVGFEYPDTIEFCMFAEGTWMFLDGGTLDLGIIRDSGLVATNQYKQFVETFEGLANIGCESYWVSADYRPTGAAAALQDTM